MTIVLLIFKIGKVVGSYVYTIEPA